MPKVKLLGVVAILATLTAAPELAQAIVLQPGANGSTWSWPPEAAGVVHGTTRTADALASVPHHSGGLYASGAREVRNQGDRRAKAQERSNDSSALPQAYGIEERKVVTPPGNTTCTTDHGPGECDEPHQE